MTTADETVASALKSLLAWAEGQVCDHSQTHRGGSIWEICDDCGLKWADDEGGKPKFEWPEEIIAARHALELANEKSQLPKLEVGQTWIGSDWKKTILKFNPKTLSIRTQSLKLGGSDWPANVRQEAFLNWIKRSSAKLSSLR